MTTKRFAARFVQSDELCTREVNRRLKERTLSLAKLASASADDLGAATSPDSLRYDTLVSGMLQQRALITVVDSFDTDLYRLNLVVEGDIGDMPVRFASFLNTWLQAVHSNQFRVALSYQPPCRLGQTVVFQTRFLFDKIELDYPSSYALKELCLRTFDRLVRFQAMDPRGCIVDPPVSSVEDSVPASNVNRYDQSSFKKEYGVSFEDAFDANVSETGSLYASVIPTLVDSSHPIRKVRKGRVSMLPGVDDVCFRSALNAFVSFGEPISLDTDRVVSFVYNLAMTSDRLWVSGVRNIARTGLPVFRMAWYVFESFEHKPATRAMYTASPS